MTRKLLLSLALIFSFSISSEEYICSGIWNNEVETSTIKRKDNYFLGQIGGKEFYRFDVIAENEYSFALVNATTPLYLVIYVIGKQDLKFRREVVQGKHYPIVEGRCVLRN